VTETAFEEVGLRRWDVTIERAVIGGKSSALILPIIRDTDDAVLSGDNCGRVNLIIATL
jgi:hypothetical protein